MIIDTHAHITGPLELYEYFRGFTNVSGPAARGLGHFAISDDYLESSIQGHLKEINEVGTDLQLIVARPWAIPTGERRRPLVTGITEQLNDMISQCVRLHPDRFIGLGSLPQSPSLSPKDALEEMERCVNELGFIGFKINPDPGEGGWEAPGMGNDYWYPIYAKLVELDVPALIHGGPFRFSREPELGYFCQEESVAGWSLMATPEVWRDFPGLKLIIGHGGGYIPYQYGRARAFRLNGRRSSDTLWEPFEESLRRLYYDTVLFDQDALELMLKICGVDRCLFGSDRPANGSIVDPRTGRSLNDVKSLIEAIPWLDDQDRQAIFEGNARLLYPRLNPGASR